jgi:hypothetical protein
VALRDRLRRIEHAAEEGIIVIPQRDGTVRRFPSSAGEEAFVNLMDRLGAGEDAPPEHPLIAAARNSSGSRWSESLYAVSGEGWMDKVEDLSE